MNNKSKIVIIVSFIIIGFIIITISNNSIIENLENKRQNSNKENEIEKPISNCISGCVINFDDCTYLNDGTSKCKWSNYFDFNNTNYDETYEQNCDSCKPIPNISYENISPDSNKNSYHFIYNNKKITLKNGEYMDQAGNIKKIPKEKHLPPLKQNETLSQGELNELKNDDSENISSNSKNTNNNTKNINNNISNDDIIAALSSHIKNTFGNYLNSIINEHINNRNVGSNLNTSPHSNVQYTNLDSSLTNLANVNSQNKIIDDNPYLQNANNSNTQQNSIPKPYDYRPPLTN